MTSEHWRSLIIFAVSAIFAASTDPTGTTPSQLHVAVCIHQIRALAAKRMGDLRIDQTLAHRVRRLVVRKPAAAMIASMFGAGTVIRAVFTRTCEELNRISLPEEEV